MSMTLEEQKLAVCEKLPGLIEFSPRGKHGYADVDSNDVYIDKHYWVDTRSKINWPTEGLQVCHEAEKLLALEKNNDGGSRMPWYYCVLGNICRKVNQPEIRAAHEQRLEALCRIWFPEKWKD